MRIAHAGTVVAVFVLSPRVVDAQGRGPQIATGDRPGVARRLRCGRRQGRRRPARDHTAERAVRVAEQSRATGRGATRSTREAGGRRAGRRRDRRAGGSLACGSPRGPSTRSSPRARARFCCSSPLTATTSGTVHVEAGDRRLTICPTDYGSTNIGCFRPSFSRLHAMWAGVASLVGGRPLAVGDQPSARLSVDVRPGAVRVNKTVAF